MLFQRRRVKLRLLDLTQLSGELKVALDKAGATKDAATGDLTLTYDAGGGTWKINKTVVVNAQLPAGVSVTATEGELALENIAIGSKINVTLKAERNDQGVNEIDAHKYEPTYVPKALSFDLQVGADGSANIRLSRSCRWGRGNSGLYGGTKLNIF